MRGLPHDVSVSVPVTIDGRSTMMHALDYRDVALTPTGSRLVVSAARRVVGQYMPGTDPNKLTEYQAVALFVDRVYWIESSGGLVMCTDLAGASFCLPIPKKHWALREHTRRVH